MTNEKHTQKVFRRRALPLGSASTGKWWVQLECGHVYLCDNSSTNYSVKWMVCARCEEIAEEEK